MRPLGERAQVPDDEGGLHHLPVRGQARLGDVALVEGPGGRLGRHLAGRHGEVHAAHLVAHVHAQPRGLAREQAAAEDVLRDHVVAALEDHVAGVLDHLGAADDGRHRRVVLEVLEHLIASM